MKEQRRQKEQNRKAREYRLWRESAWKRSAGEILDLIYPVRCPVCDRPVAYMERKDGICRACRRALPVIRGERCCLCGRALGETEREFCGDCEKSGGTHRYRRGLAYAVYDETMREIIYRFKYKGRREYGRYFGREMGKLFGQTLKRAGVEGIIPVPLHRERERVRGYNQAELLADSLGEYTGIPVFGDYVLRVKNTLPQKTMDAAGRQNNLKKAFKIGRNDVKLKITIVIDDIYTTGSTIDAVAQVLKDAGVLCVYFVVLAIGADV